ncbi:MAG: NAD-dependent epimerase/dehydratase family protein [Parahaliea sp.]
MQCLVTGATGFIGSALCAQLRQTDIHLIAVSRSGADLPIGGSSRAMDLNQPGDLRGIDVVCHLAGIAHQKADADNYQRVNTQATLNLARAAKQAGVRCFIFLSSVKAMGPQQDDKPREEGEVYPAQDPYGRSKWEAEKGLRILCADGAMDLIILRPCLVYGPSPKGNLRWLVRSAELGLPRPPQGGRRSLIGLNDLARLLSALVQQWPPGIHTWNVTDSCDYAACDLYDQLRSALGHTTPARYLPSTIWQLACTGLDLLRRQPRGASYGKLFEGERYSNAALLRDTGWQPRQTFADVAPAMLTVNK